MTTPGRFPRTPLEEAVDELNDDMRPVMKFGTRVNEYGYIILERIDLAKPIAALNLGKDAARAADSISLIAEWEREMGGRR